MTNAYLVAITASGVFLLAGLITGVWKYLCIRSSDDATAPYYVDTAHRAALMYAFAALVIAEFTKLTGFSDLRNTWLVGIQMYFFANAILFYIIHGVLKDTDNQLRVPHVLGKGTVPQPMMTAFMWFLIVGELGGFATMFGGFVYTHLL
jgi:hypothetical protein